MNSVQALDFALRILHNRQRRLYRRPDDSVTPNPTADAIETLTALREMLAERSDTEWTEDVCVCGHDADSHDPDAEGCAQLGLCAECLAIQP